MLMTTDWHPLWISYEWWRDVGTPGLSGVGGILVGVGAIVVAARTHALAKQVRNDEQKRDQDAARARYRDHLFRTVEPAVAALLDQRANDEELRKAKKSSERVRPVTNVMSRLNVLRAIANAEDRQYLDAVIEAYGVAMSASDPKVTSNILASLAVGLPRLLSDDRDVNHLVRATKDLVAEALQRPTTD